MSDNILNILENCMEVVRHDTAVDDSVITAKPDI